MHYSELIRKLSFTLSSVAHCRLGKEWNYKNVVSTFSRLFLITEGEATVHIGKTKVNLKKGNLYLIPSFTHCSYHCPEYMEQYYATFTINLSNGMNLYHLFNTKYEFEANPFHYKLFEKLCQENTGMELPAGDPVKYQKNMKLNSIRQQDIQSLLGSSGMLSLLLAEFIDSPKMNFKSETHLRISESIKFIHTHIGANLSLVELAKSTCMSPDHYTRKFKELTGQTPIDYINRQRIEKAQLLINTSSYSLSDIAVQCGFNGNSYFTKVFKKYVNESPRHYKKGSQTLN